MENLRITNEEDLRYQRRLEADNERLRGALVDVHQHLPYGDPFRAAVIVDDALRGEADAPA